MRITARIDEKEIEIEYQHLSMIHRRIEYFPPIVRVKGIVDIETGETRKPMALKDAA